MLNKKAIAAFAAGATLLSGMAFAAPAFAETAPKKPTAEQCKTAQGNIDDAKADLQDAKDDLVTANAAKRRAHAKLDKATALVNTYKTALKAYKDAKAAEAGLKDAKLADAQAKTAHAKEAFDAAAKAAEANADLTLGAAKEVTAATADDYKDKLTLLDTKTADEEAQKKEDAVSAAQDKLDLAKIHLTNLGCQASGSEQNPPKHDPTTPAQPDSKEAAIKNVLSKKVDVDAASHDFAEKKEAYTKAAAALTAAKAELDAANKAAAVAAQNLSDFEASGVNDSAKLKSLQEAVARADAHVVRTTAAFNKALADFNDAKTADLTAQDAYKAAKDAYDEAYNAAIKLGVNPALLPSVTAVDPLSPAFPQLAQAQKIYADALAGKFGAAAQKAVQKAEAAKAPAAAAADKKADKQGKITVEKGKDKAGKNLPKTGAAIALTALAASVLAGMGAAVRKVRH